MEVLRLISGLFFVFIRLNRFSFSLRFNYVFGLSELGVGGCALVIVVAWFSLRWKAWLSLGCLTWM